MIPEVICIECGKRYVGWALRFMKCYCKCGNWLNDDFNTKKEVKKVNKIPYFETKVVKVKEKPIVSSKEWTPDYCPCCGQKTTEEKKGNIWVNGENLDKIKFPVPCSYVKDGERKFGLFSMNRGYYYIADITSQKKEQEDVSEECYDLKEFILFNDIHILKGKIIIFEKED